VTDNSLTNTNVSHHNNTNQSATNQSNKVPVEASPLTYLFSFLILIFQSWIGLLPFPNSFRTEQFTCFVFFDFSLAVLAHSSKIFPEYKGLEPIPLVLPQTVKLSVLLPPLPDNSAPEETYEMEFERTNLGRFLPMIFLPLISKQPNRLSESSFPFLFMQPLRLLMKSKKRYLFICAKRKNVKKEKFTYPNL
jgi:hypothetical protein